MRIKIGFYVFFILIVCYSNCIIFFVRVIVFALWKHLTLFVEMHPYKRGLLHLGISHFFEVWAKLAYLHQFQLAVMLTVQRSQISNVIILHFCCCPIDLSSPHLLSLCQFLYFLIAKFSKFISVLGINILQMFRSYRTIIRSDIDCCFPNDFVKAAYSGALSIKKLVSDIVLDLLLSVQQHLLRRVSVKHVYYDKWVFFDQLFGSGLISFDGRIGHQIKYFYQSSRCKSRMNFFLLQPLLDKLFFLVYLSCLHFFYQLIVGYLIRL